MHARVATSQLHRSPGPVAHGLELHAAANWLGDAKGAAQAGHLEGVLGCGPLGEARFEGVGGVEGHGAGGGSGWANAGTEEVVQAWSGGSTGCVGGEVGVCGGVRGGWDDAERLYKRLVMRFW